MPASPGESANMNTRGTVKARRTSANLLQSHKNSSNPQSLKPFVHEKKGGSGFPLPPHRQRPLDDTPEERRPWDQLQPVVDPQLSHFRQVPLRTRVMLPHSPQGSPS